jgi:hypothetical protein
MTSAHARAILAHSCDDLDDVADMLCRLATIAHLGGRFADRDDSVEAAADLLAQLPRLRMSRTRSTIS